MSYRNKTYVIFDGDNDMWAYAYMKGWKKNENIDFDFYDAHDLKPLTQCASDETVYSRLKERMANTKQVVVLIGGKTKNLFKFVRWELELAFEQEIPLVAINLNDKRQCDYERCPAIIRDEYVVHIPFKAKILKYALDHFPSEHAGRDRNAQGSRHYKDETYKQLGL